MTTMELEARKASLAREVLNIDNLNLVKKLEKLFKQEAKKQEDDPYFKNPANVAAILELLEQVKSEECITLRTKEDIHKYLGL